MLRSARTLDDIVESRCWDGGDHIVRCAYHDQLDTSATQKASSKELISLEENVRLAPKRPDPADASEGYHWDANALSSCCETSTTSVDLRA